ncbi:hypothetical protein [Mycobacterium parmense]|uniref:Uncharacterized protein n=1 Tax=Mycobacterium parmense TaxID=185642 RepID=A0A7I7Z3X3_9MYCO|nr:hypothetical protein [Mycobacterium parmense]MCV7352352.1 hypothetical protein [Mycobacterium parmense]BBZ47924.1 hypothetical protein MPRM_52050 [Mycobacterium parmense]
MEVKDRGAVIGGGCLWHGTGGRRTARALPVRMGRPDEYAAPALAVIDNQTLDRAAIRLGAGRRFAPK